MIYSLLWTVLRNWVHKFKAIDIHNHHVTNVRLNKINRHSRLELNNIKHEKKRKKTNMA